MSSVIFLDNLKRVRKFIESLNKEEVKNCRFFIPSDEYDVYDLIPKKAKKSELKILLPPPDAVTKFIQGDKSDYIERYYQYLSRPLCHAALNKIAKAAVVDGYTSVVCFGDIEDELHIPKYVRKAFEMVFPDMEVFGYKDYKGNPHGVLNYRYHNIDSIVRQVMEDSYIIGRKLQELDQCRDRYDQNNFYSD